MADALTPPQIRAARALVAWSQQDLAREANIAASTIADFERGERTPVSNNFDAMRAALERAGVRFAGGGVVLDSSRTVPGVHLLSSGAPIRWIDAGDLQNWTDRRDGQSAIPELISRLILAAYGHGARLRFPAGESVQYSGWDGVCEVESATFPIPAGISVWEIGTQRQAIRRKADEDFDKRTKAEGTSATQKTYVFVTPRPWAAKDAWVKSKRSMGYWKDVQVIDADDLVHWIERYPSAGHWLATRIGKRPASIQQLSDHWNEWSLATKLPLTTELVLAGRDEDTARILRWLREPPDLVALQAEAVDEAFSFLFSAISELPQEYRDPYLARAIIANTDEAARIVGDSMSPLIIGLSATDAGLAKSLVAKGHHVLLALGSDVLTLANARRLTRPLRADIERALLNLPLSQKENENRAQAHQLALDSARSLTVIRRLMPAAPGAVPTWAKPPISPALVATLLAGAWTENNPGDREAIEKLSSLTFDEVLRGLAPLAASLDGPVRVSEGIWKLTSPRDSFLLIAPYLTKADERRYFSLFKDVLGTRSDLFGVDPEKRWEKSFSGRKPPHSEVLRRGLAETAILFSLFAKRSPQLGDAEESVAHEVRQLLESADEHLWWSLQDSFRYLAEAAPSTFLEEVNEVLDQSPEKLKPLFTPSESGFFGGNYLTDLMWALEKLAWSVDLLPKVTEVLFQLRAMDPGANHFPRPSSVLREIFVLWGPQTNATQQQRFAIIDGLRNRYPEQTWRLLLDIAPRQHDSFSPTNHPQWRDFSAEIDEEVTNALVWEGVREVLLRLLQLVGLDGSRWRDLIGLLPNFDPIDRALMREQLIRDVPKISNKEERSLARKRLRELLHQHREFSDAEWSLPEEELRELENVYDQLEPEDAVERVRWLFESVPSPPKPLTPHDWQKEQDHIAELQKQAVEVIAQQGGLDDLFRLAHNAERAIWVGIALAASRCADALKENALARAIVSQSPKDLDFAYGFALSKIRGSGMPMALSLLKQADEKNWPIEAVNLILSAMPVDGETWRIVDERGEEVRRTYWTQIGAPWIPSGIEDVVFAAERLLEVGKSRRAIDVLGHHHKLNLPTQLVIRALRDALSDETKVSSSNEATMFAHHVGDLLDRLDNDPNAPQKELVALEWGYFPLLRHSRHKTKSLQRALAEDPAFFVELIKAAFLPDKEHQDDEPEIVDKEKAATIGSHAWRVLEEWRHIPGADKDGKIDANALNLWITEARALSAKAGRLKVADIKIGQLLARAQSRPQEQWPPSAICDVIEKVRSKEIESGFSTGLFNSRGMTSRGMNEGGQQERELAAYYRKHSKNILNAAPRTAAVLEKLARGYEVDAKRVDERVERRQWGI